MATDREAGDSPAARRALDRERLIELLRTARTRVTVVHLAVAFVALYTVWRIMLRLRLGADGTDEAFYAVLQHRFTLGDKPYVDEVNLRQSFSFIPLPFYWAYFHLRGSTDGVMLFLRGLYFVFTCLTSLVIYRFALVRVGRTAAVVIALVGIAFVPFNVPTCSYNTLGCTFLTSGIFLTLWRLEGTAPKWTHFASGFAHGLAIIAYPPIVIAVVLFGCAAPFFDDGDKRFRNFALYVAGGVTTVLLILPLLRSAGASGIREAVAYERALTAPRTVEKLKAVFEELWTLAPTQPRLLVITLLFIVAARHFAVVRTLFLPLVIPAIAWWVNTPALKGAGNQHCVGLYFNVYAGMAGVAFLALRPLDRTTLRFLFVCFLPSAVAGITNGYSSDNGAMNSGLGAFPASVLALILATEIASSGARRERALWWAMAAAASIVYYHIELAYSFVYRDDPAETLKTRVSAGPYMGMYTSVANNAILLEVHRVMKQHEDPRGRVLSFYDFPAGYLSTKMKVGMPSSWTDNRIPASPFMMNYYKRHLTGFGLVVRWPVQNRYGRTELENLVEDPARILYRGSNGWILYREPPPQP